MVRRELKIERHTERNFGGARRNRTADKGFADLCLTTWRPRHRIRKESSPQALALAIRFFLGKIVNEQLCSPRRALARRFQKKCSSVHYTAGINTFNPLDQRAPAANEPDAEAVSFVTGAPIRLPHSVHEPS